MHSHGVIYSEDEFLQLSGIQHFRFCRRQWALIHIENQWAENYRTIDGMLMHKNAHDTNCRESRSDRIITRGVSVFSSIMGVSGQCDVLEYHHGTTGIEIAGKDGLWQPYPVEYKRGSPRNDDADELQLCGQALCLEEMLCCEIPKGALYYGEIRHRKEIVFAAELRQEVQKTFEEMHMLFQRGYTPKVKPTRSCNACSLQDLCLPRLMHTQSVNKYLLKALEEIK